ncbi:MAG: MerR family transcriptional regulator [Candidatus Limnocylindria bacterium]
MTTPDLARGQKAAPAARHHISEAARRVGVSPSALRMWEQQGLIRPARNASNRYRLYTDADIAFLGRVRRLRQVDRLNAPGIRRVLSDVVPREAQEQRIDGRRLRHMRHQVGLSLRQASEQAGLSVSFLSALERGVTGASITTLRRVTAAYGTSINQILGSSVGLGRERVVRAGRGRVLRLGEAGVRIEQLARGATQLEPQLFVLPPQTTSEGSYAHEGEEFLYLLAGSVTVWIGDDESHRLTTAGDALTFPSTLPHRWRNDAAGESRLLWINTPPTF